MCFIWHWRPLKPDVPDFCIRLRVRLPLAPSVSGVVQTKTTRKLSVFPFHKERVSKENRKHGLNLRGNGYNPYKGQ